ncbi:sigma-54-dependent transcriptional regulator [Sulfurivermis fontis]|uniref:sigma-54-dependent transcriptional regulator n=1 Tax=Sulfurivermis fontis TaxID=1972068 RepID=UPI000FDB94E4|nr:sigma-54 dependent transcriptional regulator [Sulfurivermis fontis]
MSYTLLIAEDDRDMARLLAELAADCGFRAVTVHTGQEAAVHLAGGEADALFTDLRLPGPDGLTLLRLAHEIDPALPVVLVTGYATVQNAIDAFRNQVADIITKPFDTDEVSAVLARIFESLRHRTQVEQLTARLHQLDTGVPPPVMHSRAMREVMEVVHQVADADIPVLLNGETGTGKSMLARLLHTLGARREQPYFSLNCAGIAPTLAESELFGHEKGAFTGATQRKKGLLELADGGTLLLDEINSAPPEIQVRLLQFLQERTLMRVGGQHIIEVDVRLVCATNQPLDELVAQGRFRADLYYRLKVFPIDLPPLRERSEDIVPLAEQLLSTFALRYNKTLQGFTPAALDCLRAYRWPGNVRELENIVQRAVVLARGEFIEPIQLPAELRQPAGRTALPDAALPISPDATLAEVETWWIRHMLERCDGNKTETARRLGIDASTLHRKLRG